MAAMIGSKRNTGQWGQPQTCHDVCIFPWTGRAGRKAAKRVTKAKERAAVRRFINDDY